MSAADDLHDYVAGQLRGAGPADILQWAATVRLVADRLSAVGLADPTLSAAGAVAATMSPPIQPTPVAEALQASGYLPGDAPRIRAELLLLGHHAEADLGSHVTEADRYAQSLVQRSLTTLRVTGPAAPLQAAAERWRATVLADPLAVQGFSAEVAETQALLARDLAGAADPELAALADQTGQRWQDVSQTWRTDRTEPQPVWRLDPLVQARQQLDSAREAAQQEDARPEDIALAVAAADSGEAAARVLCVVARHHDAIPLASATALHRATGVATRVAGPRRPTPGAESATPRPRTSPGRNLDEVAPLSVGVQSFRQGIMAHGLTPQQWGSAARTVAGTLQRHGISDPQITAAATLGTALGRPSEQQSAAATGPTDRLVAGDLPHLRITLALAARTAAGTADQRSATILAAAEQALVVPQLLGVSQSLRTALDRCTTVALAAPATLADPRIARALALSQASLADDLARSLGRVESPSASFDTQRLAGLAEESKAGWMRAANGWAKEGARVATSPPQDIRLGVALRELHQARRVAVTDPVEQVVAIAAANPGKAVAAALSQYHPHRDLDHADRLADALSVLAHNPDLRAATQTPEVRQVAVPAAQELESPTPQREVTEAVAPSSTPDVGRVAPLTRDQQQAAADRRDLGVLAQAALDGREDARQATAGLPETMLHELAHDGQFATATLVASVVPMTYSLSSGRSEDARQAAHLEVTSSAYRWDPTRGVPWPSYAYRTIEWAYSNAGMREKHHQEAQIPIPTAGLDGDENTLRRELFVSPDATPEVDARIDSARTMDKLTASLTGEEREAIRGVSGATTGEPLTRAQVGDRMGISTTKVQSLVERAGAKIRRDLDEPSRQDSTTADQSAPRDRIAALMERLEQLGESSSIATTKHEPAPDYAAEYHRQGPERGGPGLSR